MTESSSPQPMNDGETSEGPAQPEDAASALPSWLQGRDAEDVAVTARLLDLLDRGWAPRAIHDALVAEFGLRAAPARLVREQALARRPVDASRPWRLADAEPSVAALVMPVVVAVCERTHGVRTHIDAAEAEWVATLRAASPELPLWGAYRLAAEYARRAAAGAPADDLDAALALAPWRDLAQAPGRPADPAVTRDTYDAALERLAAREHWQRYRAAVSRSVALAPSYPLVLGICSDALLEGATVSVVRLRRPRTAPAASQASLRAELRLLRRRVERLGTGTPAGRPARRTMRRARPDTPPDAATTAELAALAPHITRLSASPAAPAADASARAPRPMVWPPRDLDAPLDGAARLPFGRELAAEPAGDAAPPALALVVSPVEGFRGLIEVQDAFARVPGVGTARVDAFAHGDARMTLELSDELDPEQLTSELGRLLGRIARVATQPAPGLELKIALG